ncbi:hypothetical protein DL771_000451 [Monosporascus sp. 5C6A]|nr:hypothetical protein DL771_000451 [Monosporascus sp. 5C6A]
MGDGSQKLRTLPGHHIHRNPLRRDGTRTLTLDNPGEAPILRLCRLCRHAKDKKRPPDRVDGSPIQPLMQRTFATWRSPPEEIAASSTSTLSSEKKR